MYTLKVTLNVTFKFIKYIKFLMYICIYIKGYIYIKFVLNVNIYESINDYSFKYICLACYLKLRFYCLTCSAMSNLTSPDFTTTRQSSEILILKIEMLEFQDKKNIEIIGF